MKKIIFTDLFLKDAGLTQPGNLTFIGRELAWKKVLFGSLGNCCLPLPACFLPGATSHEVIAGNKKEVGKLSWPGNTKFSIGDFKALLIHVENGFEAQYAGIFQHSATLDWFVKIYRQLNCSLGKWCFSALWSNLGSLSIIKSKSAAKNSDPPIAVLSSTWLIKRIL